MSISPIYEKLRRKISSKISENNSSSLSISRSNKRLSSSSETNALVKFFNPFSQNSDSKQLKPLSVNRALDFGIAEKKFCCTCKKSRCLKKYCVCYANGERCRSCNCVDCLNTESEGKIAQAIVFSKSSDTEFCNCAKSGCKKSYCECYKNNRKCNDLCRCLNCSNQIFNTGPAVLAFEKISVCIHDMHLDLENTKLTEDEFLCKKRETPEDALELAISVLNEKNDDNDDKYLSANRLLLSTAEATASKRKSATRKNKMEKQANARTVKKRFDMNDYKNQTIFKSFNSFEQEI